MTKRRDFDSKAATWDDESRRLKLAREVADGIIKAARPTAAMDAMDFGCGTGLLTLFLQPYMRSIDGIDNSKGMLDVLEGKIRKLRIPNVRPLLCDLELGARPLGPYHLIVSSMTLHHIEQLAPLFRLFNKLLHPGGTVCIADLDREDGTFHDDPTGILHPGFERADIREILAGTGFTGVRDSTVAVVRKALPDRGSHDYPVFLICAEKPS